MCLFIVLFLLSNIFCEILEVWQSDYVLGKNCDKENYLYASMVMFKGETGKCVNTEDSSFLIKNCKNAKIFFDVYKDTKCKEFDYSTYTDLYGNCTEVEFYEKIDLQGECVYKPPKKNIYFEYFQDDECKFQIGKQYFGSQGYCLNFIDEDDHVKFGCLNNGNMATITGYKGDKCTSDILYQLKMKLNDCVPADFTLFQKIVGKKYFELGDFPNAPSYYIKMPQLCVV